MIVHPDADAVKKDWDVFMADDGLEEAQGGQPVYKDNAVKVISLFLRPAEASQI